MKIYRIAVQTPVDPNNPDPSTEQSNAANAIQQLEKLNNIREQAAGVNSAIDLLEDAIGVDMSDLKQAVSNKLAEALPQIEAYNDVYNNVKFNVEDMFDDGQWAFIQRRMTEVNTELQTGQQAQSHQ